MSLWEYKHITSGPHGFATPALLEAYLNQLGKDEWEIINFQSLPANPLAFNGIARRTTLRDWTLESAAAAAAKIEADKLRAEFTAKFQGAAAVASASEASGEKPASIVGDTAAPEDGFRKLRDTTRDDDPDAPEDGEDWDNWENLDDDLPTLFEAIKPHLRKNQRGPGMSVGVLFLAKRWEQSEGDLVGALKECGFIVPESEETPPEYLEFEGELYWLNLNNRHELFLNTREKPRPVFRVVPAKKIDPADPVNTLLADEAAAEQAEHARRDAERVAREAEHAARRAEREAQRLAEIEKRKAHAAAHAPAAPAAKSEIANPPSEVAPATLPQGEELLAAIRPQMRRNRRGAGYSGSTTYLSRAFRCTEADLVSALAALGLQVPADAAAKPVPTTIGAHVYWLNKDSRGGIWINGDEAGASQAEVASAPVASAPAEAFPLESPASAEPPVVVPPPVETPVDSEAPMDLPEASPASPLAALRLLLMPNKRGTGVSAEIGHLARLVEKNEADFFAVLTGLGFALPAADGEKPAFVEHNGEVYWLNKNPKDGSIWLNAKGSKSAAKKAPPAIKPRAKKPAKKDE